jgi:hypothetical protein
MSGWNFYMRFQGTQKRDKWYQAKLEQKQPEKPPEQPKIKLEDKVKKYDSE